MQSSFGFRMATVLEYIWREKKRLPLQQMWLVVVSIRLSRFILAKVSLWKREGFGREWFAGLLFYADPSLHFSCYHQIGAILPWAMDEKVKISPPSTPPAPMPLAEDCEHSSLLLLCFGFLSLRDLWEHIWKTLFFILPVLVLDVQIFP